MALHDTLEHVANKLAHRKPDTSEDPIHARTAHTLFQRNVPDSVDSHMLAARRREGAKYAYTADGILNLCQI